MYTNLLFSETEGSVLERKHITRTDSRREEERKFDKYSYHVHTRSLLKGKAH
jgi:hypothetical protein